MRHILRTRRTAPARQGRGSASPCIAHHTPRTKHRAPRTTHRAPTRGLPEPQRDHQILPNNVARNSPRSFFDYASKRCNSNATNSKFEISARELRATFMEGPAASRPAAPGTPATQPSGTPVTQPAVTPATQPSRTPPSGTPTTQRADRRRPGHRQPSRDLVD